MNEGVSTMVDEAIASMGLKDKMDVEATLPKAWKVVAGGKTGGLLAREGQKLASAELPERLAKGAVVEELELQGERLKFFRLSGEGPREGWVSTKQKGSDLLVPLEGEGPADDEWVYSKERAQEDYNACAGKMMACEGNGKFSVLVEATAKRADKEQIHVGCLVCAEAGHLTPMLRAARGLAERQGVWRVSIVSNNYGAGKLKAWLSASPDASGKIQVLGYQDGWDQGIQDLSNKYSQAEDGKLHGLQNDAMPYMAVDCLKSIHQGEEAPTVYVVDGASNGFLPVLQQLEPLPKYMMSVALVIIASVMYNHVDVPVLFHSFELPPQMSTLTEAVGQRPAQLVAVGTIADEVKPAGFAPELEAFLAASELPVLYVSMGSQGIFTREQLRRVVAGLRAPGEWRVIWSLREEQQKLLPGGGAKALGEDFFVSKWLPQAELLQHPKVKAFMAHCGWGATCEAIASMKPVVALPLFADQNINAWFLELFGMGKTVGSARMNVMDQQSVSLRFLQVLMLWTTSTDKKRVREVFTAKGLNDDVRLVLTDKSFERAAKMVHFMDKRQKGGVAKLADAVERYARGQPVVA